MVGLLLSYQIFRSPAYLFEGVRQQYLVKWLMRTFDTVGKLFKLQRKAFGKPRGAWEPVRLHLTRLLHEPG